MNNYICFEGVPGAGKSFLTEKVSEHLNSSSMFEIVEENPFLEKFYKDPEHWSFQTEAFFLCNRYMQLKKVRDMLRSGQTVVSDYHILKNLIFAQLTLEGEELSKYKELYNTMIDGFMMPNIIVYSEISLKEVIRRINLRGRVMEKDISHQYLKDLIDSYEKAMSPDTLEKHYPGTQLIKINADTVDFIKQPEKINDLYDALNKAINDKNLTYQEVN